MNRLRPWLGRCCFLLLVLVLGVGLYLLLADQPLWTLDVDEQVGWFAADGAYFFTYPASREYKGPVRLRDSRTGAEVESFFTDGAELKRPEVSGDRRYLAAIVEPNEVRVIDFQERRAISLRAEDVNGEYQLHFSPQSDMLQVRAAHAKLPDRNFVFELPGGQRFGNPDELLHVRFSPTGRHLAYVKKDGLHLWDRLAHKKVGQDLGDDEHIQFSPDGRRLVTYEDRGEKEPFRLVLWDLETYRRVAVLPVEQPLQTRWAAAAFSLDSRWLVTWHDYPDSGHVLETWDAATGKRLGRYVRSAVRCSVVVAPDSFGVLLNEWGPMGGEPARVTLTMLEMPAAKVRPQRKFEPKSACNG